eukprot:6090203-Amphidinium_carterae.1
MAAFILRRKREMKELTDISPQTTVSGDVQAQLLLRFSGLTAGQRSQVIAAAGNRMDFDSIEQGLRAKFSEYHFKGPLAAGWLGIHRRLLSRSPTRKGGRWSKGSGGKPPRRAVAYVAEDVEAPPDY